MKPLFLFMLALLCSILTIPLSAQQIVKAGKMTFSAHWLDDQTIEISLEAPTQGWLAVGFNQKNNILNSDLIMLRVKGGKVEGEDQFVTDFQKHPKDTSLGGSRDIKVISGVETTKGTSITLQIPAQSADTYDFIHQKQKDFWLILAYSVDDDFDHHSIMRKHFLFQWE